MSFSISHRPGGDDRDPPRSAFDALLDEVEEDPSDHEHVNVAVTHESGWCIGIYSGWRVVLEHLDEIDIQPRHIDIGHDRAEALRLMNAAADGELCAEEQSIRQRAEGSCCLETASRARSG